MKGVNVSNFSAIVLFSAMYKLFLFLKCIFLQNKVKNWSIGHLKYLPMRFKSMFRFQGTNFHPRWDQSVGTCGKSSLSAKWHCYWSNQVTCDSSLVVFPLPWWKQTKIHFLNPKNTNTFFKMLLSQVMFTITFKYRMHLTVKLNSMW